MHIVDRVLNVRRDGRTMQVLVRWRGHHEDEWLMLGKCNELTQNEAKAMARLKFPKTARRAGVGPRPASASDRSNLRRQQHGEPPAKRRRLRRDDGRPLQADAGAPTPVVMPMTPRAKRKRDGYG